MIKKWICGAVDLLYPPRCPLCNAVVSGKCTVCRECQEKIRPIEEPFCKKCGKPLHNMETEYCKDCSAGKHLYTKGRGYFSYQGGMKRAILDLKYFGRYTNAGFLGMVLARLGEKEVREWKPEVIIPVPIHRKRRKERGYNQAELLAEICSRVWKIPMDHRAVIRTQKTVAQKKLDPGERRKNIRHAFQSGSPAKDYQRVLIIDDIYTTGSTVDAVSRILLQQGVKHIFFLTVCIGNGD